MVTPKQLVYIVESSLLDHSDPSPEQRRELLHALRSSFAYLKSPLSYPPPRPSDRAKIQLKEVRLPDSSIRLLSDQAVQIALKLSDELHLNELDCVQLLVSANQVWGFTGREPLDIFRLAAALWYLERHDMILALLTLFMTVVVPYRGLEAGLLDYIQKYLEDLISAGLRQRLISLIKELNQEEPSGLGGPLSECYLRDRGEILVERRAVVCDERVIVGQCLALSVLVVCTSYT